ncbi:MAG: hypothetical protein HYW45_02795 [Candidatus Daviesbacteria bacterium]|nr:MAG: hypothetical protein HYW45_02795 [Candidatus Daviesbacteria bacterium]
MAKPRVPLEVPRRRENPDVANPFPDRRLPKPNKTSEPMVVPVEPEPVRINPREPVRVG